jgi:energy-coupling factor transporter ATP-binding protein EcfA2
MKPTHVGISNFRSIGEEPVILDLTKKINVLVGANNCGKSNVIRALCSFGVKTENELDLHKREKERYPIFWVKAAPDDGDSQQLRRLGTICFGWSQTNDGETTTKSPFASLPWPEFEPLWQEIAQPAYRFGGWPSADETAREKARTTIALFFKLKNQLPQTALIPQFRQITVGDKYSIDGRGIVGVLSRWQHPKIGEDTNKDRFLKIQKLLQSLIQLPHVTLEVDHSGGDIVVNNESLRLPLESYGTGIHQLIILAIAVLNYDNSIVCIEEPEIHLHPLLQRRFFDFLRKETNNQYVVTTHAAALISLNEDTAVTHLWLETGVTKSRPIETTRDSIEALRDLGVKASDILQANSVIWVEGPSDRIYIKHWLDLIYPARFREGIDYSIMFYGGRLISHLSLDREPQEDTDDLIRLLNINQHSAIVIDSDRRKAAAPLNPTKERVKTECAKSEVLCWITDGREIENYLPADVVAATYRELSKIEPTIKFKRFDSLEDALRKALLKPWKRSNYYSEAKPQMARKLIDMVTIDSITPELRVWIDKLAKVIAHE